MSVCKCVCTVLINKMLLRCVHDVHCVCNRFYASPADDLTMTGIRTAVRVDSDARDGAPSADAIRAWMGIFSNIKVCIYLILSVYTSKYTAYWRSRLQKLAA
jgi:hypothetical protein